MEDNSKLFVFEKKEVFLIFLFIVLIAAISFTLGVRTGKELSLKEDGYTATDIDQVNLKSVDEEQVESLVSDRETMEQDVPKKTIVEDQAAMEERLRMEMEKLADEDPANTMEPEEKVVDSEVIEMPEANLDPVSDIYNQAKSYKGKFTIQLYSNQNEASAKDFADGFIAKGYDVIINEAVIAGKGKWYRVSIGAFENINAAKDFLDREKETFSDNKYIIQQF